MVNLQQFPEMGDQKSKGSEVFKKDGFYERAGGAAATQTAPAPREKQEYKKPTFTGLANLKFAQEESSGGSKMHNYDMSTLKTTSAPSKATNKNFAGGDNKGPRDNFTKGRKDSGAGGNDGFDDFETVTAKKEKKPRNF